MIPTIPILDVRPVAAFEKGHHRGAVNIPLEELADRIHELPARDKPLIVFDTDRSRAAMAERQLRASRENLDVRHGDQWLAGGELEHGKSCGRLWSPHAVLERALNHIESRGIDLSRMRVLDLACGSGRDAVYMATRGMQVESWDNLPDALDRCRDLARRNDVQVNTQSRDLESQPTIPMNRFEVITCFNFLHRPLMGSIAAALPQGGWVIYETFLEAQRELFGKPQRSSHLLKAGELPRYFAGWEIIEYSEGLAAPRRIVASMIARKN